jgi:two-component system, chemotaxis family, sensor kinase CheA
MNIDDALPTFIAESADLLRELEAGLLQCSNGARDPEVINLIFRSAHTIKGSAGLFGLEPVVAFVHVTETALDAVRLGITPMTDALVTLLLHSKDHIEALIARLTGGDGALEPSLQARGLELVAALKEACAAGASTAEPSGTPAAKPAAAPGNEGAGSAAVWGVEVRFGPDVLRSGMDPLGFIRYLSSFGKLLCVKVLENRLPTSEQFDPESCYLGFEIEFQTDAARARIEAAFEFVRDDCELVLTPPRRRNTDVESATESASAEPTAKAGLRAPGDAGAAAQTVRVDAHKLDMLINHIGELIISAAGATLLARRTGHSELQESTGTLCALVEQVRENALQLRMVKIGATFNRFQRVVRDVSRELGKDIRLVVQGEDTELDKTVVEQIGDPLTHLVRNAIDHGIESAEQRSAHGKSPVGTVTLNAFHDSGSIVIEVSDDGGGLRRDKILAKAIERGLVEEDRTLSDSDIFNLIFEPGFSTATQVTNLSGRGVGLDVVKRNITSLRGGVSIRSAEGAGTTITVRLPLTLAIINGFQIGVGNATFVMPLETIDECIEFSAVEGHDFTNLRGQVLPFVRLRELFHTADPPARRQSIVVVNHAGQRAGLVVDALLGEFQTVIKPLGKLFRAADYASGSSILGNGDVALILDVPALIEHAIARASATPLESPVSAGLPAA